MEPKEIPTHDIIRDYSNAIHRFLGNYAFLSNFYYCDIAHLGYIWPTLEHAYVAAKLNPNISSYKKFLKILHSSRHSPREVKKIGRTLFIRPDWEEVKFAVMFHLLQKKFSDENLKQKLLDTGNKILIEGNYWGDQTWGMTNVYGAYEGRNALGKFLMELRERYRNGA